MCALIKLGDLNVGSNIGDSDMTDRRHCIRDLDETSIASDIDPTYAKGLHEAVSAGVEVLCYGCDVTTGGISVAKPLKIAI